VNSERIPGCEDMNTSYTYSLFRICFSVVYYDVLSLTKEGVRVIDINTFRPGGVIVLRGLLRQLS
jgi:hypothetical protein